MTCHYMGSFVADFPTFATKCALFIQNAIDLNEGYPHVSGRSVNVFLKGIYTDISPLCMT